jgi:hypothetical protein
VHAVAALAGGLVAAWQWSLFARFKPRFGWGWAMAAGIVMVPVTYVVAIAALSIAWEAARVAELIDAGQGTLIERLIPLIGHPFAAAMLGAAYATMLVGPIHVPLAVAASLTATWWARRGMATARGEGGTG